MRVVITRPAGDAQVWMDALNHAGHSALALPLIEVGPATHPQAVAHAWTKWGEWQAVMFVSAQAVRYFFECQPDAMRMDAKAADSQTWANGPRCWATGPGTHKALVEAGVPDACIDCPPADAMQFDSEALWQRVSTQLQAGQPVLIVRGQDVETMPGAHSQVINANPANNDAPQEPPLKGTGRDWLAQQLQAAGVTAHFVVAYERCAPVWTAAQKDQAHQAATDGSVWCFSSSQAIAHLAQALPAQRWGQARCIATHARIASTAQALGFGEVHTARPSLGDVLRSLESLA